MVYEVLEFANAVQVALDFAAGRDDTLIIVTADHETGGLSVLADNGPGVMPNVSWSTHGHTDVPVPVYAFGLGAELILDVTDNTDLFSILTMTSFDGSEYPEPSSMALAVLATLGIVVVRLRPRRQTAVPQE